MKLLLKIAFCFILIGLLACSKKTTLTDVDSSQELFSVGFYNLENLFDTVNDSIINDEEFLPEGAKQWTVDKYNDKLERLSTVISDLANLSKGGAVNVLGVSEIENKKVLEDLISTEKLKKFNYKIIHFNSPDVRGVDVGLLYQSNVFTPLKSISIPLYIYADDDSRIFTRDVLLVKGILGKDVIYVTVNHWPSRRGGEEASRPKREAAARLNRSIIDSILTIEPEAKIFVLGDLNDNPNNESIKTILAARKEVKDVKEKELYNPFYSNFLVGHGTLAHNDSWSLFDQVILTKGASAPKSKTLQYHSHVIYQKDFMMEKYGQYKNYPKRTFSGNKYNYGYSDHFPVYVYLKNK